jgi:Mg-chelatase subunit ChlD
MNHSLAHPAPGSIADKAKRTGQDIANVLKDIKCLCVVDVSGSMDFYDSSDGKTRYERAVDELLQLQKDHDGAIGLVSFADSAEMQLHGGLPRPGGSTNMTEALEMAMALDGACTIVVISDGEPNSESTALAVAKMYFNPVHTIYVGPEDGFGRDFLAKLARMTGGLTDTNFRAAQHSLAKTITKLLTA